MQLLIGIDEAGYGPNLGPLVVAATVWRIDEDAAHSDDGGRTTDGALPELYPLLQPAVRNAETRPVRDDAAIVWADSKLVYHAGAGLGMLERGVLAALAAIDGELPPDAAALRERLTLDRRSSRPTNEQELPLEADRLDVLHAAERVAEVMQAGRLQLIDLRATIVEPADFNALLDVHGNKASALTSVSCALLAAVVDGAERLATLAVCDKHGGRNQYHAALQYHFPDNFVTVLAEGREESRYRMDPRGGGLEVRFRARGETFLPTALASMTAKYVREVTMAQFNRFWRQHLPGLRPTAGYPVDARRFKREIAAKQAELGLADSVVWRAR